MVLSAYVIARICVAFALQNVLPAWARQFIANAVAFRWAAGCVSDREDKAMKAAARNKRVAKPKTSAVPAAVVPAVEEAPTPTADAGNGTPNRSNVARASARGEALK